LVGVVAKAIGSRSTGTLARWVIGGGVFKGYLSASKVHWLWNWRWGRSLELFMCNQVKSKYPTITFWRMHG